MRPCGHVLNDFGHGVGHEIWAAAVIIGCRYPAHHPKAARVINIHDVHAVERKVFKIYPILAVGVTLQVQLAHLSQLSVRYKVRFTTRFAMELLRGVLAGDLSLALVTAPPEGAQITAVPFARAPLYSALSEDHPAANKERLVPPDLANDEWILFARQVHPVVYDAILEAASFEAISPKDAHDSVTAQQAVYLVSQQAGIAIFAEPPSLGRQDGVLIKPLCDKSLSFETCLIVRADQDSRG